MILTVRSSSFSSPLRPEIPALIVGNTSFVNTSTRRIPLIRIGVGQVSSTESSVPVEATDVEAMEELLVCKVADLAGPACRE